MPFNNIAINSCAYKLSKKVKT